MVVVFGHHHSAVLQIDVATPMAPTFEQMTPHMKLLIVLPILDIGLVIKNVHRGTTPLSLDFSDLSCLAVTFFTHCHCLNRQGPGDYVE